MLHGSSGVPDASIAAAIEAGMTKINVSTHLNGYFTRAVRARLDQDERLVDSRKYLGPARDAVAAEAARLLSLFALRPAPGSAQDGEQARPVSSAGSDTVDA